MAEKMVILTQVNHEKLLRSHRFLSALEAAGVDNWDGYGEAYREAFPNEDEDL